MTLKHSGIDSSSEDQTNFRLTTYVIDKTDYTK